MIWQDWILTFGQFIFVIALVPSIKGASKPSIWTSIMTASILTIYGAVYWSLDLSWSTTGFTLALAIGWWILAWQAYQKGKMASVS